MSYTGLGQMSATEMAQMAARAAQQQAQQRYDQEQALEKIDPQLVQKQKTLEKQFYQLWNEYRSKSKTLIELQTQNAELGKTIDAESDLKAERRKQLMIVGGAAVLATIFIVLAPGSKHRIIG